MKLCEAIADCMRNKGWPDAESREMTIEEWCDFNKKLKEPIKPKYILNSSIIDPHWITEAKKEINSIYGANMFETEIDSYIQHDIKTTVDYSKMFDERKEKDMNNGFKERAAQAVFFNKYLHRYEKIYIEKVIFNDPATIVFWNDRVKTVVKCQDGDIFDPEKGLAMAITKRFFGNQGNYCNEFQKWLPEEEETINFDIDLTPLGEAAERMGGNISKAVSRIIGKCEDCKYENVLGYKWPCVKCVSASKWKPKKGE